MSFSKSSIRCDLMKQKLPGSTQAMRGNMGRSSESAFAVRFRTLSDLGMVAQARCLNKGEGPMP